MRLITLSTRVSSSASCGVMNPLLDVVKFRVILLGNSKELLLTIGVLFATLLFVKFRGVIKTIEDFFANPVVNQRLITSINYVYGEWER